MLLFNPELKLWNIRPSKVARITSNGLFLANLVFIDYICLYQNVSFVTIMVLSSTNNMVQHIATNAVERSSYCFIIYIYGLLH